MGLFFLVISPLSRGAHLSLRERVEDKAWSLPTEREDRARSLASSRLRERESRRSRGDRSDPHAMLAAVEAAVRRRRRLGSSPT